MPKPTVPVDITKGIDTKRDPRRVEPPYALDIENGELDSVGAIKTRHGSSTLGKGYEAADTNATSSGTPGDEGDISTGKGIFSYKDQLLLHDGDYLYRYAEHSDYWVRIGELQRTKSEVTRILELSDDVQTCDSAVLNGIRVVTLYDATAGAKFAVFDANNGALLVEPQSTSNVAIPVAFDTKILVFFNDTNYIRYYSIDTNDPQSVIGQSSTILGDGTTKVLTSDDFDFVSDPSDASFAFFANRRSVGGVVVVGWTNENGVTSGHGRFAPTTLSGKTGTNEILDPLSASIASDGSKALVGGFGTVGGTSGRIGVHELTTADSWATFSVSTVIDLSDSGFIGAGTPNKVTVAYDDAETTAYMYAGNDGGTTPFVKEIDASGFSRWHLFAELGGRYFRHDGRGYIPLVVYPGDSTRDIEPDQTTHAIVRRETGRLVSKASYGVAGRYTHSLQTLPRPKEISTDRFETACLYDARDDEGGVQLWHTTFNVSLGKPLEFGDSLYFPGAVPALYDGFRLDDIGFLYFPNEVDAAAGSASGNLDATAAYSYKVVYDKYNHRGERYQSTHVTVSKDSGGNTLMTDGSGSINISVPNLSFAHNTGDVKIAIYRTESGPGSRYYFVVRLDNDPTSDTQTYTDTLSDDSLITNHALYTEGEAEALAPEPCSEFVTAKYRVFSDSTEDPLRIQMSKSWISGRQLEFNDTFVFDLDPEGGNVTALSVMDDLLLIFKKYRIFGLPLSQLPNNAGGGGFSTPRLINTDVGCVDADTVVSSAEGVYFQSDRGLRLLTRGLEVQPVGVLVEDYKDQTFTAATLMPGIPQIRWLVEE